MAVYACVDCGQGCSDKAFACPHCGRLVRARGWWAVTIGWGVIMSGVISTLLVILITVITVTLLGGAAAVGAYFVGREQQQTVQPRR